MENFLHSDIVVAILPFAEALGLVILGFILDFITRKLVKKVLSKTKLDSMIHNFIGHVVQIGIWVVVVVSVLGKFGIDSSSIITVLAACGAAVALALQGSLSNLASGIIIMVSHPFKSGDYIISSGVEGTVQSIDLLFTTIETDDKRSVTIPNASLTGNTVTNTTASGFRRCTAKVGVAYASDIELGRKALIDLVNNNDKVEKSMSVQCDVLEYADSAITLFLRFYVKPEDYWNVMYDINNKIKPALDAVGIEIAFPQLDVHNK